MFPSFPRRSPTAGGESKGHSWTACLIVTWSQGPRRAYEYVANIKSYPKRNLRSATPPASAPRHSYCSSIERRAALAAGMIKESGWTAKQTAGAFCVSPTYLGLALKLGDPDRLRLARGELKLSALHKDHLQRLTERRAQRLAEERAARVQAERAREVAAVDGVLESVGLDCVVDRIVSRNGPRDLIEELDVALQRRGQDFARVLAGVLGPDRLMGALDLITAPSASAAKNDDGPAEWWTEMMTAPQRDAAE